MKKFLIILLALIMLLTSCKPISDVAIRRDEPSDEEPAADSGQSPAEGDDGGVSAPDDEPGSPESSLDMGFSALLGSPAITNPNTINAPYGALYNLTDNIFVYGKNIDERVYPSGAAKLLTALTVCDALDAGFLFTVGSEIDMIQSGSGVAGLRREQVLGLEEILTALLIPVGNDAAYTIAVNAAKALSGSDEAGDNELNSYFLTLMNNYAKEIGCTGSSFTNPDGYHAASNYTTVRDLAIIAAYASQNPLIAGISGKKEHEITFASGENASWSNSNAFLALEEWDIRGLRTGYTDESMFSAHILAVIDGKEFIITVSGCADSGQRERDVKKLLELAENGENDDVINVFDS